MLYSASVKMHRLIVAGCFLWCIVGAQVKFPGANDSENNKVDIMTGTQGCNAGQDCVPHFQCKNGQIKTDGGGILSDRGIIPTSNCVSSKHSGEVTICCGIPGWVAPATTVRPVVTCDNNQKCVKENLCDVNGNIRTDGGGLLSDRIYDPKKCSLEVEGGGFEVDFYRSTSPQGVCCTPPTTATTPSPWVVAPECGISSPTPQDFENVRIANPGHNEAYFGQFPWQAAVFFSNFTFQCGGTIIGDRWVLTAAHCIHGASGHELKVRVGEWQVNSFEEPLNYEDVGVRAVKTHEEYSPSNSRNNIAILELIKPLVWQYHINRICLPCDGQDFWGERCIGTGWGKDTFTGNFANILKRVDLPIVDDMQCQKQLRKTRLGAYFNLHDSFLCAGGEDNTDTCKGDGGGPLACQNPDGRYVVAGITSSGIDCGIKDVPGLYTEVGHFLLWIRNIIGGSHHSGCDATPQPPHHQPEHYQTADAIVKIVPGNTDAGTVTGSLEITKHYSGILITGYVTGLTPGLHGFHIHMEGKLTNNCRDAAGHFNPFMKNHGSPKDAHRHVGDLGNILADDKGMAMVHFLDSQASLESSSQAFIGGRGIVIHAGEDDLGRGNDEGSLTTGNAGGRVACGVIEIQQK